MIGTAQLQDFVMIIRTDQVDAVLTDLGYPQLLGDVLQIFGLYHLVRHESSFFADLCLGAPIARDTRDVPPAARRATDVARQILCVTTPATFADVQHREPAITTRARTEI